MTASPEYLLCAQQFGAADIFLNTPELPAVDGKWQLHDLVNMRRQVESYGMKLSALENVPRGFCPNLVHIPEIGRHECKTHPCI